MPHCFSVLGAASIPEHAAGPRPRAQGVRVCPLQSPRTSSDHSSTLVSSPLLWGWGDLGPCIEGLNKPPEMLEVRISHMKATAAPKPCGEAPQLLLRKASQRCLLPEPLGGSVRFSRHSLRLMALLLSSLPSLSRPPSAHHFKADSESQRQVLSGAGVS